MSKAFSRGLAWFFAVLIALGGLMNLAVGLSDKGSGGMIGLAVGQLVLGSLWCAYLYGSGVNNKNLAKKSKLQDEEDMRALEVVAAAPLVEIRPSQALLKPDEKAYGAIAASLQEEKTLGYSAGTQGVSVRVAKGLTLRTSGTRAMPVKGMVEVAKGELVITDRRVIFAGDRKSFVLANADLINTTNYSDGFGFTDGAKTYTLTTGSGSAHKLFAVVLHKVLRT